MNFTLTPSLKTIINVIVLVTPTGLKVDMGIMRDRGPMEAGVVIESLRFQMRKRVYKNQLDCMNIVGI